MEDKNIWWREESIWRRIKIKIYDGGYSNVTHIITQTLVHGIIHVPAHPQFISLYRLQLILSSCSGSYSSHVIIHPSAHTITHPQFMLSLRLQLIPQIIPYSSPGSCHNSDSNSFPISQNYSCHHTSANSDPNSCLLSMLSLEPQFRE